jgi:TonB family protein
MPSSVGVMPPLLALTGKPLLALSHDKKLLDALRQVSDAHHEVCVAGSEVDLATALVAHHAGVVVLDSAALSSAAPQLTARLHTQFPDVVLIVAGTGHEQGALTAQITDGSVHRFLHKPVSEQRVRLFVESAWRRHAETQTSAHSATGSGGRSGAKWLLLALGAAALAAPLVWLGLRAPQPPAPAAAAAPVVHAPAATASDAALESLLARADQALASGALVAPAGRSAADLYREALSRNARDPRAVNGLEQVIDRLLSDADAQLQAHHLDEAQQLAGAAHNISPDHPRVAFLLAQIGAQRERAVLERAQRAAASGNVAGALAVLDDAPRTGHRSTLVDAAREQLAQKQVDEHVADFLGRARTAMESGQLMEPAEANARFYVESARALAPADAGVQQMMQAVQARLMADAGQALKSGNLGQAELLAGAAADLGAPAADVTEVRIEAQKLRGAAKADSLAQLSLAFTERLSNGHILEPAAESAKSYLAQLQQAEPDSPATQAARNAYNARALDEARGALHIQDYAGARRWLGEARSAGADAASISTVEGAISAAQDEAQQAASYVSASSLTRTSYVAPEFPTDARQRGIVGWVDLQFVVNTDGSVGELTIVGAQPVGIFEQAALDAVRRWHYAPVLRAGQAVSQRTRMRVRFQMQP